MRKILLTFGLFISLDALCYIDTIPLSTTISSVEVHSEGTWIKKLVLINLIEGEYVLQLHGFPLLHNKDFIIQKPEGLTLLSVENIEGNHQQFNWESLGALQADIDLLLLQLKDLDADEKKLLDLKRLSQNGSYTNERLNEFKSYFHEQGIEIRKKRLANYQKLLKLRESLNATTNKIPLNRKGRNHELYLRVSIEDTLNDTIHIKYMIKPSTNVVKLKSTNNDIKEELIVQFPYKLNGKVITNIGQLPLTAAEVQLYNQNHLIYSTVTDQAGNFSIEISHQGDYRLVIKTDGYQKRKIKQLVLNQPTSEQQPYLIQLREKISFVEFLSYALPAIDIVNSVVK